MAAEKAVIDVREDSGKALLRRMAARRRRDNIVFGVLAALAVIGGGATILGWFLPEKANTAADSATTVVSHAQLAGAFAQDFVTTYLTTVEGQKDRLAGFVNVSGPLQLSKTRRDVSDPAVVYVRRTATTERLEVWAVTVAVRVATESGRATSGQRQYYAVAVSLADGGLRAMALPALVDAPPTGADVSTAYAGPCTAETPLGTAVSGFLAAYLTGSGDLGRYTTANAGITALQPVPYATLGPTELVSDDDSCGAEQSRVRVLATVTPNDGSGSLATLAYPLTMVRTDGQQWQVESMDIVPALSNPVSVAPSGPRVPAVPTSPTEPTTTVTIPPAKQN